MAITEIRVRSLGELVDRTTPPDPDPATGRRRDLGVYRGSGDARWPLLTSLDRLGGVHPPHTKRDLEAHVYRGFLRYSRPHVESTATNEWELLVSAQHHGVPTRLLDWTYSPLVAAHFATLSQWHGADIAVWRLDWRAVHRAFGFPELAMLIQDLHHMVGRQGEFTPWKLFGEPDGLAPFACMLEPPSLDARIVAQSAVFTLCSDKTRSFDAFLATHGLEGALARYVIAAEDVPLLRDQLDLVGVDERRIYPDLDGVAAELRRYYS